MIELWSPGATHGTLWPALLLLLLLLLPLPLPPPLLLLLLLLLLSGAPPCLAQLAALEAKARDLATVRESNTFLHHWLPPCTEQGSRAGTHACFINNTHTHTATAADAPLHPAVLQPTATLHHFPAPNMSLLLSQAAPEPPPPRPPARAPTCATCAPGRSAPSGRRSSSAASCPPAPQSAATTSLVASASSSSALTAASSATASSRALTASSLPLTAASFSACTCSCTCCSTPRVYRSSMRRALSCAHPDLAASRLARSDSTSAASCLHAAVPAHPAQSAPRPTSRQRGQDTPHPQVLPLQVAPLLQHVHSPMPGSRCVAAPPL